MSRQSKEQFTENNGSVYDDGHHDTPQELGWLSNDDNHEPEPEYIAGMPSADALTPSDRYLELFEDVQSQYIFEDSKTFADCAPKYDPVDILILYRKLTRRSQDFSLHQFVKDHFHLPEESHNYAHDENEKRTLRQHIDALWPIMIRDPQSYHPNTSLLPLPKPYVVPGGRFTEVYYWDSYFSMLGLAESGNLDLIKNMTDNFAWLIEKYGHIPNGNRTYYLSRSQPPVFALMVELCESVNIVGSEQYLPYLISEYHYWMDGSGSLNAHQAFRHVVKMSDGSMLNRYWDDRDTPRDESWREDIETASSSNRPAKEVFRDLRAGAASGWDYSSRWLRDPTRLASIRTTQYIPIDLNALLYKLEVTIATLAEKAGETLTARAWEKKAKERLTAINRWLWDEENGVFRDYDWCRQQFGLFSAAAPVTLFTGLATPEQAARIAQQINEQLLAPGGLLTTTIESGEQWDKPNAWAPLQWMAIQGLKKYGHFDLAEEIAIRWLTTVNKVFKENHKLVEKYNVMNESNAHGGGGEYPLQDGFGWTNGVTRCLISEYGHLLNK
ncbi:alpha,alpha-trehalase TreF [Rosenbergiella australiborealis]|uniref:Alpha,alpha-trehalase TreF n=1 Tax=Rosenbergiella australiborealis TaxID=1544696 RepID=A0ABS5T6B5_9GAMM|nr:alpha,alpha-trehalase TreF [Rosenbergiella australiborealis]MBT0727898.1 alpha,alpha-trehalase TreF [Rosenbergiella australiborealis]